MVVIGLAESYTGDLALFREALERDVQVRDGQRQILLRQTVNAIETGKYSLSLEVTFQMAEVFGVRVDEVFHFGKPLRSRGA